MIKAKEILGMPLYVFFEMTQLGSVIPMPGKDLVVISFTFLFNFS